MAEEGVFFKRPLPSLDPIDASVADQLALRGELYARKMTSEQYPNFTRQFVDGNNAFVKLTSGIEIEDLKDAAKNNILFGGTLWEGEKLRTGISDDPFQDIPKNRAYNFAKKEGYVPMPGIIDFKVINRGNSGFSREAQLTIKCFSLEQLSILEKLYLRPGYKCLLEWGHTIYGKGNKDKIDSVVYTPETIKPYINGTLKEEDIKLKGSDFIKNSQNNYDFMLGLIKNYDWSYENDGYILNVELLGKGAITTFLQSVYGGTDTEEKKGSADDAGVEFTSSNQSTFGGILSTINQADKKGAQGNTEADKIVEEADMDRIDSALKKKYEASMSGLNELLNSNGDSYEFKVYRAGFKDVNMEAGSKKFNYISMRTLLGMVNYFFLKRPSTSDKIPEGMFNTTPGLDNFLTYPEHFSIDPAVCLLPQQTGLYGLKSDAIKGTRKEERGDILDIQLNTSFLYEEYKKMRKDEDGKAVDISIGKYLNGVLGRVGVVLGGINQFTLYNDFYLDKKLGPSKIIDLQLTPRPEGPPKQYTTIFPKGQKSFISDFSFNSELSNSMINLIVNQAILQGVDAGKATTTATAAFNTGILSAFEADKSNKSTAKSQEYAKKKGEAKKQLQDEFKSIFSKLKYDQSTVEDAYANGASLIRQELDDFLSKSKKAPKRGHIGAKVSMTMVGIGGLKSLQYFLIPPDVLPESYSKNIQVAFQISNVSHAISNQQWTTTIDANCVILSQS